MQKTFAYRMTLQYPQGCVRPLCDFFLGINDNKHDSSVLDFTLEGKAKAWVAVAFSKNKKMVVIAFYNHRVDRIIVTSHAILCYSSSLQMFLVATFTVTEVWQQLTLGILHLLKQM